MHEPGPNSLSMRFLVFKKIMNRNDSTLLKKYAGEKRLKDLGEVQCVWSFCRSLMLMDKYFLPLGIALNVGMFCVKLPSGCHHFQNPSM